MLSGDLTEGPVRRHLLRMAGFMFVGLLINNVYALIDLHWAGRLGPAAVASISLANTLLIAVMALNQVLSVGTVALVSAAAGRQDRAEVRRLFNQSFAMAVLTAAMFLVGMSFARVPFADALAGDADTARLTAKVLIWYLPAMAMMFPMMTLAAALRSVGDVRSAARVQIGSVLLNILLSPILIFGWGTGWALGAPGAGLASLLAVSIGCAALVSRVAFQLKHFQPGATTWKPEAATWARIARIGLPAGAEFGMMAVYFAFAMAVLQPFGSEAQAAFGIGMRWMQLGVMGGLALSFAAAAVAGQNFGAGRGDRVRETVRQAATIGLMLSGLFCGAYLAMPTTLIGFFTEDPEVLAIGVEMLNIVSWNLLASAMVFVMSGTFSGLGHTVQPLAASVVRYIIVIGVTLAMIAAGLFKIRMIWELQLVATLIQVGLNAWMLQRLLRRLFPVAPGASVTASAST